MAASGETGTAHNLLERRRTTDVLSSENINIDFASLLLSEKVQRGLTSAGFEKPSPIQLKAIPLGRCGLDLIVQAKSGTGKTCVFSVIALESIIASSGSLQVLVLAPTREIAVQIQSVIEAIGSAMEGLKCYTFIGGTVFGQDRQNLKKCHIAVGTPGRIKQLIEYDVMKTESVRLFILDEADKLLDEKFQAQVNWIYHQLPENKQMLALSATYPESLAQQLTNYMRDPTFVRLNPKDLVLQGIKQFYKIVPGHELPHKAFQIKADQLLSLLSQVAFNQCLIFSNLQSRAQNLCDLLLEKGWPATYISGNQEQTDRMRAMMELKTYKCRILVSTDLTARGIDAENVNLIINLDVPADFKTYLHRIGRAGRFGTHGAAISLASEGREVALLKNIQRRTGSDIRLLPEPLPSNLLEMSGGDFKTVSLESDAKKESFTDNDLRGDGGETVTDVIEILRARPSTTGRVPVTSGPGSPGKTETGRSSDLRENGMNGHDSAARSHRIAEDQRLEDIRSGTEPTVNRRERQKACRPAENGGPDDEGDTEPTMDGMKQESCFAMVGEGRLANIGVDVQRRNGHVDQVTTSDVRDSREGGAGGNCSPDRSGYLATRGRHPSDDRDFQDDTRLDSMGGSRKLPVGMPRGNSSMSRPMGGDICKPIGKKSLGNRGDIARVPSQGDIGRKGLLVEQSLPNGAGDASTLTGEDNYEDKLQAEAMLNGGIDKGETVGPEQERAMRDLQWRKRGPLGIMGLDPDDWVTPLTVVQEVRRRPRKRWTFEEALNLFESKLVEGVEQNGQRTDEGAHLAESIVEGSRENLVEHPQEESDSFHGMNGFGVSGPLHHEDAKGVVNESSHDPGTIVENASRNNGDAESIVSEGGNDARDPTIGEPKTIECNFDEAYSRFENCDIMMELRAVRGLSQRVKVEMTALQKDSNEPEDSSHSEDVESSRGGEVIELDGGERYDIKFGGIIHETGPRRAKDVKQSHLQSDDSQARQGRNGLRVEGDDDVGELGTGKPHEVAVNINFSGQLRKGKSVKSLTEAEATGVSSGAFGFITRPEKHDQPNTASGEENTSHTDSVPCGDGVNEVYVQSGENTSHTDSVPCGDGVNEVYVQSGENPPDDLRSAISQKQSKKGKKVHRKSQKHAKESDRMAPSRVAAPTIGLVKKYDQLTVDDLTSDHPSDSRGTSDKTWEYFKLWARRECSERTVRVVPEDYGDGDLPSVAQYGHLPKIREGLGSLTTLDRCSLYSNKSDATYLRGGDLQSERSFDPSTRERGGGPQTVGSELDEAAHCSQSDASSSHSGSNHEDNVSDGHRESHGNEDGHLNDHSSAHPDPAFERFPKETSQFGGSGEYHQSGYAGQASNWGHQQEEPYGSLYPAYGGGDGYGRYHQSDWGGSDGWRRSEYGRTGDWGGYYHDPYLPSNYSGGYPFYYEDY